MAYQLRSAMEFVEDGVLKTFKQDLKKVKVNHAQCSDVVHNIVVGSEESFELLKKTLLLLDRFDSTSISKGEGSAMAARLKCTQDLCFSALAQMEHCIKRVRVYVSRCAEVEYWRTAVRMSHFVSPRAYCAESLSNTRSTESFYLLQDFWWSVDVVQLATVCLKKLLTTVVDGKIQYDAFKWCNGKCRLVLKDGGECDYTVLKEDNKEDNICLHHKADLVDSDIKKLLQQLKMEVGSNFAWFLSAGQNHEQRLKMFLKQVLEGPPVRVGYLPSTLKLDYHDIKLSDRILGQGSFGVILEGKWHGETVAVKYIKLGDDFEIKKQLLEKEVALLASLHHHNIVRLIGFTYDEETKNCVIVMERMQMNLCSLIKHNLDIFSKDLPSVKTGSVPRFVENQTPFPLDVTIDLLLQIIEGMCHLRDFRVIHRDLRSANILVNKCAQASSMLSMPSVATNLREFERGHFYHAKVADFGTSKSQMKDSEFFTKGKGTVKWMAPEVLEATFEAEDDTLHYSWDADVYSFGITCSEILTGELPFQDVSGRKLLDSICAGVRPPLPPDCPDSLKRIVCECWDTNPQNRPNCWQVRERLWGCKLEMFLHHKEKMSVGQTFCNNVQRFINHTVLECGRANSGDKGAVKPFIRTMITNVRQLYGFKQEVSPEVLLKRFSFNELRAATDDFDHVIGGGRLGLVYEGVLWDTSRVAVKVLEKSKLVPSVLWNEVAIISGMRHRNLMKLKGFCEHYDTQMLVYEFVGMNLTLEKALWGYPIECKHELDWSTRLSIVKHIAEELVFLHEVKQPSILEWDINARNIFLDNDLNPKIFYFGSELAFDAFNWNPKENYFGSQFGSFIANGRDFYFSSVSVGSSFDDISTTSNDVFKFGILIFDIICGRRANIMPPKPQISSESRVRSWENYMIEKQVDPALRANFDLKEAKVLLQVARLCYRQSPTSRLDMKIVTLMLKGDISTRYWVKEEQRDSAARIIQNAWKHWKNLQADNHEKHLFYDMQLHEESQTTPDL